MPYELLLLEISDRIATVTINRPDKLNALNDAMMREIGAMMDELTANKAVGVIIITGAGRAFVAGAGRYARRSSWSTSRRSTRC